MQHKPLSFPIRQWSEEDRPREKMMRLGPSVLTDSELLAILIRSGNRNESALDLAKRILSSTGNSIYKLGRLSPERLVQFKGIGWAKALTITAALELGKRRKIRKGIQSNGIKSSEDAYRLIGAQMGELEHEEFWILYLNNSNRVIEKSQLSKGGITGTLVDVRLLIKKALELNAVSLILSHNHPSGTLKPSKADKSITDKIFKAAELMDIRLLDHLIITEESYFSFADNKMLP